MYSISSARRFPVLTSGLALCAATIVCAAFADGSHDHGGDFTHPITTDSPQAQKLFDGGLMLAWGFNHEEAARSFREATELDPECAMCWWGVALVLGPNINAPLDPDNHAEILTALDKARRLAPQATASEQSYIRALATRYGPEPLEDRSERDKAWADAMRRVAYAYPDDLDAATLFAEALMDTSPWDYWKENGEPKENTEEFIGVLETVLRREPLHAGANHLLVHAVEKARPEIGIPAAERLDGNPQATGHLVHMASHIYMRVGRWDDAARVNARAIEDDDAYAATHEVPESYMPYMLHNHHMRWAALGFEGREEEALEEALYLAERTPPELLSQPELALLQHFHAVPLFHSVWFSDWERILAAPEPGEGLLYSRGLWHWARGMALARAGRLEEALPELSSLRTVAENPRVDEVEWGLNKGSTFLRIAEHTLSGEVALGQGQYKKAIRRLEDAVDLEDSLVYTEPPPWLGPTRLVLARAQMLAGRPGDAEATYRADLEIYPLSGWALSGLAESLEALDRPAEAEATRQLLSRTWTSPGEGASGGGGGR